MIPDEETMGGAPRGKGAPSLLTVVRGLRQLPLPPALLQEALARGLLHVPPTQRLFAHWLSRAVRALEPVQMVGGALWAWVRWHIEPQGVITSMVMVTLLANSWLTWRSIHALSDLHAAAPRRPETVLAADQGPRGSVRVSWPSPVSDPVAWAFLTIPTLASVPSSLQAPRDVVTQRVATFTDDQQQWQEFSKSLLEVDPCQDEAEIQQRLTNDPVVKKATLLSPAKGPATQLILGRLAHHRGDLTTARIHYESITESQEAVPETVAAAWFGLAVLHAHTYEMTRDPQEQERAIAALQKSVASARRLSPQNAQERIKMVMHAVTPVDTRGPYACDPRMQRLEDLTVLSTVPNLYDLVAGSNS